MKPATSNLWQQQNRHPGDRKRLFTAVKAAIGGSSVLYPGSYVDVAVSFVYPSVTYVDVDRRAARFFADEPGVTEVINSEGGDAAAAVRFIHSDYTLDLGLEPESFDVLVSLYAGFVSEACTDYLRVGGTLLAGPSHGDVAMASIDPRYQLCGVITSRDGDYRVRSDGLDAYLIPKSRHLVTKEMLHQRAKGIAYTKSPFAYLFAKVSA